MESGSGHGRRKLNDEIPRKTLTAISSAVGYGIG